MNNQVRIALAGIQFDNRLLNELPVDPNPENNRRQVYSAISSRVHPSPVSQPRTILCSPDVLNLLGLHPDVCKTEQFARVFSGNELLPGMDPHATCYGGHQFGHWAGQLGDGRAINLGEMLTPSGEHWTLQLKGAGPTPYSRGADGRAVLRSSIREFLCSEAMHHLGVPTTRALSLVLTGDTVMRDMFYDGNPEAEPGAVVCRVARSFTRFGHFQLPAARGDEELLRKLIDFTIEVDFPHLAVSGAADSPSAKGDSDSTQARYLRWFEEICQRTMDMILHWQRVGFVHGVMNTDNMSILGLTIDYGPYGWIDDYDPDWTPNTTDAQNRRYRFGQQPAIAHWNLYQLANALVSIIGDPRAMEAILEASWHRFEQRYQSMLAAKLGLGEFRSEDSELLSELEALLQLRETDMTIFFRRLAQFDPASSVTVLEVVRDAFYPAPDVAPSSRNGQLDEQAISDHYARWEAAYRARLQHGLTPDKRVHQMNSVNPVYVLRNYLAQAAIDEAQKGNYDLIADLLTVLRQPYEEQPGKKELALRRPDWARNRAGCSMLSCSS